MMFFASGLLLGHVISNSLRSDSESAPVIFYEEPDMSGPAINPYDPPRPVYDPLYDMKG